MSIAVADLVRHFQTIHRERMQGLPIVNPRLDIEAIGFGYLQEHQFGILLTPWFMNLLVLPGNDEWSDVGQGSIVEWSLPYGDHEFTSCQDDALGTYLTAVLFRTVADFPDQETARAVAEEILRRLRAEPEAPIRKSAKNSLSRRAFLAGSRAP